MNFHPELLIVLLFLWLTKVSATIVRSASCQLTCGNLTIPYPFGIGKDCYFNDWFEVTCGPSAGSMKPFLRRTQLEILQVIPTASPLPTIRVSIPVISSGCGKNNTAAPVNLSGSPFSFSASDNRFTVIGCSNYATMMNQNNSVIGGCLSVCNGDQEAEKEGCFGINCCQTAIPPYLKYFKANISNLLFDNATNQECRSAFMVDKEWFDSNLPLNSKALTYKQYVPATLEWGVDIGVCFERLDRSNTICEDQNNFDCKLPLSSSVLCQCFNLYDGYCRGDMLCLNNNCSECPVGYYNSSKYCSPIDNGILSSRVKVKIITGCISGGLGMLLLIIGGWRLYKFVKRRRQIKLQKKFYKRNGGLLLQQELSSNRGNVDKTKLFTSKELEKATDKYNTNRILGQGGQGTVYKGMLADGRIVAVKKSKIVDESKVDEFINEVVILSQINHRNVVKLLGCCLETIVPLLVYEFIPNGTLFQYIHDQTEGFPINWDMLLRIAVEVSGALSYLHSAASIPIYHRDIKSANILLDDKFRAKISDFGTSRSMTVDQTHLTTQVQGTFGYLDPEYFRSSQFTEKSDVYSFGVVLAELLTGQKPIRSTITEEDKSLAAYFLSAMKENRLFEVLDSRVLNGGKEEIITVARLAQRCLNLSAKKRPTMREVASTLMGITASSNGDAFLPPNCEELFDYDDEDIFEHNLETASSSGETESFFKARTIFSIDADSLISKKVGIRENLFPISFLVVQVVKVVSFETEFYKTCLNFKFVKIIII